MYIYIYIYKYKYIYIYIYLYGYIYKNTKKPYRNTLPSEIPWQTEMFVVVDNNTAELFQKVNEKKPSKV